jgi:hypothetical protein
MDKSELKKKLRGAIVKMEPVGTGITQHKLKLTFADGTQAIFKPASGEVGGPHPAARVSEKPASKTKHAKTSTEPTVVNEKEDTP